MLSTLTNKIAYLGNSVTTVFAYGFEVLLATDMVVLIKDPNNVITTLTAGQYNVTGIGNPGGGTVTYPLVGPPLAPGYTITIARVVPYLQTTAFPNQGGFYPAVLEGALDTLVMQTQQLAEAGSRAISIPLGSSASGLAAPPVASSLIGWDLTGTVLTTYPLTPLTIPVLDWIGNYGNDLGAAVGAIGAAAKVLLINVPITLTGNVTVPNTLELWIPTGGMVSLGNYDLSVSGRVRGHDNSFAITGTGVITHSNRSSSSSHRHLGNASPTPPYRYQEWWDTTAIPARRKIYLPDSAQWLDDAYLNAFPGAMNGLGLSYTNSTTFGVAAGACRAADNLVGLVLGAAFSKTTAAWAVGTGNGSLDTGSLTTGGHYHVWLIRKDVDGAVDILISLSSTAPTMPAGWVSKRRIGSFRLGAGVTTILPFTQFGTKLFYDTVIIDSTAVPAVTKTLVTVSTPPGVACLHFGAFVWVTGAGNVAVLDIYPNAATAGAFSLLKNEINITQHTEFQSLTNTSNQIAWKYSVGAPASVILGTCGFDDFQILNGV